MSSAAVLAKSLVMEAAKPLMAGEKVKAQKQRAHNVLQLSHFGKRGDHMLHEAWNGRATGGTYTTLLDQAIRVGLVRLQYRMLATDPEFFQPQTEAISNLTSSSWGACNYKRGRR